MFDRDTLLKGILGKLDFIFIRFVIHSRMAEFKAEIPLKKPSVPLYSYCACI